MKKGLIVLTSIILAIIIMVVGIKIFVPKNLGSLLYRNLGFLYEVKSNRTEFKVDKVTLDFYYGHRDKMRRPYQGFGKYKFISYALFFLDGKYYDDLEFISSLEYVYEDYHNIDGLYLVKELTYDEFSSDEYRATWMYLWKYNIPHREKLTIPKEVFERDKGSVVFMVVPIYYLDEKNGYCLNYNGGGVYFDYEYISENKIRLSKPIGSLLR